MRKSIEDAIKKKSKKILRKKRLADELKSEYEEKFATRTGMQSKLPAAVFKPFYNVQLDPRASRSHAKSLSWGIWHKALIGNFSPLPALLHRIDKPNSTKKRDIMEFGIADSAFANVINDSLLARNMKRFSANSYAYRPDRNQFDAIINLKQYLKSEKTFVIQFDFQKFFDSIPHKYIFDTLSAKGFISISALERGVVAAFIEHRYAPGSKYPAASFYTKREGTPQGSSLSLFLANLANDALDKRLENVNGQFVRYADDVVAVANTYEDALKIEQCFHQHCSASGLKINYDKSDGIRLLSKQKQGEIATIHKFRFVGYDFYPNGVCAISDGAIEKIEAKLSRLINIYLIHYPKKFGFNHARISGSASLPFFDWDLMGLVTEVRGYLYGGCKEEDIRALIDEGTRIPPMRGLMSFYALVDRKDDLRMLDGWMVNNIRCALAKRRIILWKKYNKKYPAFSNKELILGSWYDASQNSVDFIPDSRLPSFVRGWRAARKYYLTFGLEGAAAPPYSGY